MALVDDSTTMAYFLEYQIIGPLLSMKMKSNIDF